MKDKWSPRIADVTRWNKAMTFELEKYKETNDEEYLKRATFCSKRVTRYLSLLSGVSV